MEGDGEGGGVVEKRKKRKKRKRKKKEKEMLGGDVWERVLDEFVERNRKLNSKTFFERRGEVLSVCTRETKDAVKKCVCRMYVRWKRGSCVRMDVVHQRPGFFGWWGVRWMFCKASHAEVVFRNGSEAALKGVVAFGRWKGLEGQSQKEGLGELGKRLGEVGKREALFFPFSSKECRSLLFERGDVWISDETPPAFSFWVKDAVSLFMGEDGVCPVFVPKSSMCTKWKRKRKRNEKGMKKE